MPTLQNNARYQKIQSHVRRNEWKKAYNETVFLGKQTRQPEVQALLVSTLWGWIKDQVQRNQYEDAKKNIQELLRQPEIAPEIRAEFPSVFRILGLNALLPEEERLDMSSPEIQIELVDRFLVQGVPNGDLLPETLADAQRIQRAFQMIEAKQDTEAHELLRPIAFRSPLAEWRLFLRGLTDHYHGNSEKAEESWRRLSPERPPFRIVAKLRLFLSEQSTPQPQGMLSSIFSMFRKQSGTDAPRKSELPDTLRILDGYLKEGKYKELLGRFQSARALFQQELPLAFERLFRVIHQQLIRNASPDIVRQFINRNLPLPLDPKGNRTLALLSEHIDNEDCQFSAPGWLSAPRFYWRKFIDEDIDQISSFSPKMKARAKAVVFNHLAMKTIEEYLENLDIMDDDEDRLNEEIDVQRTKDVIVEFSEQAIGCDPTYVEAYRNLQKFYIVTLPKSERKTPFHPRCVEIEERLLKHVPDSKESLLYLFEYHQNNRDAKAAKPYYDKLCELDPLSRETMMRRVRFNLIRIREGIRNRDWKEVDGAIDDMNSGSAPESIFYRFDLLPLALQYIAEAIRNDRSLGECFAVAPKLGIEKRLPLVFSIIVEGRELDLPTKYLEPLEDEWNKAITGRCNGNNAAVLADAAFNFSLSIERYPKSQKMLEEVYEYVNRAGQVKWNSEKDIFCATHLLWHLAVEEQDDNYAKTFGNLAKKGRKQFPNSLLFLFFEAESQHANIEGFGYFPGSYRSRQATKSYQEFLQRLGAMRSDPQFAPYAQVAEQRLECLDNPFGGGSGGRCTCPSCRGKHNVCDDWDDDDDNDWDDDDDFDEVGGSPFGGAGLDLPPDIRRLVKQKGGFPKEVKEDLIKQFPVPPLLAELMLDALEECVVKGISTDNVPEIIQQKIEKLPPLKRMAAMMAMMTGAFKLGIDPRENSSSDSDKSKKRKKR